MLLNSALRSTIKHNALKTILDKDIAMSKREHRLFERCYNVAIPLDIRTAAKKLSEDSKEHWLRCGHDVMFNVAGQNVKLSPDRGAPIPHNYYGGSRLGEAIAMDKHPKLVADVRAWQAESEALKVERARAEKSLDVLLKSVRTTEGLFKVWPEGKKFYSSPPLPAGQPNHLPAVQLDLLNKALGLVAG